jgi:uncharacterized protein YkwD
VTCPSAESHLEAINSVRSPAQPLHIDNTLQSVAQSHADFIAVRRRDFDRPLRPDSLHLDANDQRVEARLAAVNYKPFAEEIAGAGYNTAAEVMQAYLDSPPHRPWLLWPAASKVGLGCTVSYSGRVYWVHVIGLSG